jgi:hypothetical protein
MSVIARSKSGTRRLRRGRETAGAAPAGTGARPGPATPSAPVAAPPAAMVRATDIRARHRAAERPQDEALYTCSCGFVFAAAVSASVDCPHCGSAQAW